MSLEQKINYQLNKYPKVKKVVKRVYEHAMYAISPKIKCEGNISRISPDDPNHEYFFGYYDKSPWDITDRYMLCMKANDTWSDVSPREKADILIIDTEKAESDPNRVRKIAETRAWNVQQACMLQWLGPDFSSRILYNDYRDGKYVSVILTLKTMREKVIPAAVYSVSADGKFALTLDFSRLYELRPGYGYYNIPEKTKGIALPDTTAIWKVDLESGEVTDLLKYTDFANFQPRPEMKEKDSVHKVNHIMISPNGKRFMVLYRWFSGQKKYTRLITCNVDGTDMYVLSDDDMVSHCFWKNDFEILAFENKKKSGPGYYLMRDKTQKYLHRWPQLDNDGHPSYSPNRCMVVTDTYPSRSRIQEIKIMNGEDNHDMSVRVLARVFSPFKYDDDTRCDLHPRWNHSGTEICFDGSFEGHRGLYKVPVKTEEKKGINHAGLENAQNAIGEKGLVSCIIPSYKRSDTVTRAVQSVLNQTYSNVEVLVVDDNEPGDEYCKALKNSLKVFNNEKRVRYISQKQHINGAAARNVGIREARGEYIAFLDDDDEWLSTKIEKQIAFIKKFNVDATSCYYTFYKNGQLARKGPAYNDDNLLIDVLSRSIQVMAGSCFICKKRCIVQSGMFDESLLRHQDLQMLVDFLNKSSMKVLKEYLVIIHEDSTKNQPSTEAFINIKRQFFKAMEPRMERLTKSERKRIIDAHYFEIVVRAIKERKMKIAFKYLAKIGFNPKAYQEVYKRYKSRKNA
jgi:glycosyltransferase involved in cell wall biosynthesis